MNLANKLTVLRIALVPIIVLVWLFPYSEFDIAFASVYIYGGISLSYFNLIILGIFALASFTDFLDGRIARKRNLITTFGKFADPIADKLLVNTMFVLMAYERLIPIVPVIIMICRDTIVDGCRMVASRSGVVVPADILGKLKTVLQMFAIILVLLNNLPFALFNVPFSDFILWFATLVSFVSGYSYYSQVREYIFESK